MYLQHFGLEKSPFSLTPDPQFLFLTSKHREALAALILGVSARKGLVVLTGEAGTGKTTLVAKLLQSFPPTSAHFSVIINPALTRAELFECILIDFHVKDIPSSKAARLSLFKDLLIKANAEGKTPVVVIDEAHLLGPDLIEELRLLSNFETAEHKLLQIVLVGQKELNQVLNLPSMTPVRQRIAFRMQLDPLQAQDVGGYVRNRWARAGTRYPLPFSASAIEEIGRFSGGIPRLINVLCDASLINAYGAGKKQIDSEGVLEVARDLQLPNSGISVPHPPPSAPSFDTMPPAPQPVPSAVTPIQRYMPPKRKHHKLLTVSNWLRLSHPETE